MCRKSKSQPAAAVCKVEMQEPILEALTFAYQSVNISDDGEKCESVENQNSYELNESSRNVSVITQQLTKALEDFNNPVTTPCPFPLCPFKSNGLMDPLCENINETQEFLKHLLVNHNLVIDDVASIANLHRYLIHWGEIWMKSSYNLENHCVAFWMDQPMTFVVNVQKNTLPTSNTKENSDSETRHKYFMLTDVYDEDKNLRSRLWSERLESVLEINRLEREQNDISYKCPLFCKEVCVGNRANLFLHMAQEHSFHVGQPDNIVFVTDFLELIQKQFEGLKCIYCEKTFKDRTILKEHMRKKQHKKINPLNPEYDRFYMVNYLEAGKTWQSLEQESADEEKIEEDWIEMKDETNQIICLICPKQMENFDDTLNHMFSDHSFNFTTLSANCNFYQKVKLVNFIRRNMYKDLCFYCETKMDDKKCLVEHVEMHQRLNYEFPDKKIWDQSEFLFPTYENDQFLMFLGGDEMEGSNMEIDQNIDNPTVIPEDLSNIKIPPVIHPPPDLDLDSF